MISSIHSKLLNLVVFEQNSTSLFGSLNMTLVVGVHSHHSFMDLHLADIERSRQSLE